MAGNAPTHEVRIFAPPYRWLASRNREDAGFRLHPLQRCGRAHCSREGPCRMRHMLRSYYACWPAAPWLASKLSCRRCCSALQGKPLTTPDDGLHAERRHVICRRSSVRADQENIATSAVDGAPWQL
eukprot:TRINITY_DN54786_c0_g1_i2.p2 TRINITY_DN54786_c0_g1~~TRINITY_DN54786_c0_g1_i2.p2  ORF type:complete len:127 (+),score=14.30 TRINITY_DN54786_c0_g1_i2:154-534(+)